MDIFINKSHPAGYHASKQYFCHRARILILQIFTYTSPSPFWWGSFGTQELWACAQTSAGSVSRTGKIGEMETLDAHPQIPHRQAVQGVGKTLPSPGLLACPGNDRWSKGCWRIASGSMGQCCLIQVILQSLMRHPTFSRTHLTPERCRLTGRAEAAAKLFSANADSRKATKN